MVAPDTGENRGTHSESRKTDIVKEKEKEPKQNKLKCCKINKVLCVGILQNIIRIACLIIASIYFKDDFILFYSIILSMFLSLITVCGGYLLITSLIVFGIVVQISTIGFAVNAMVYISTSNQEIFRFCLVFTFATAELLFALLTAFELFINALFDSLEQREEIEKRKFEDAVRELRNSLIRKLHKRREDLAKNAPPIDNMIAEKNEKEEFKVKIFCCSHKLVFFFIGISTIVFYASASTAAFLEKKHSLIIIYLVANVIEIAVFIAAYYLVYFWMVIGSIYMVVYCYFILIVVEGVSLKINTEFTTAYYILVSGVTFLVLQKCVTFCALIRCIEEYKWKRRLDKKKEEYMRYDIHNDLIEISRNWHSHLIKRVN